MNDLLNNRKMENNQLWTTVNCENLTGMEGLKAEL